MENVTLSIDETHHIIVYDDHLKRPIYFLQKGVWYAVEGSCERCGTCCENTDCKSFEDKKCLIHSNKPIGCALFPSGTPDHYCERLTKVMLEKCKLTIRRLE